MRSIFNDFYFGRTLPHVVIALDTPAFGAYETRLLRHLFLQTNQPQEQQQQQQQSHLVRFGRPLLICADGAYRKVQQSSVVPDFVVGDLDSLNPPDEMICQTVDTVRDYTAPHNAEQLDKMSRRPFVIKVRDQDTTDFEKSLLLCEQLLCEGKPQGGEPPSRCVLVIGGDGGEWHHQMAVIHAAARYAGNNHQLDVRLHSPHSTIMFCMPNGQTIFRRNPAFESTVFAVVPFGRPPRKVVTKGLNWEIDSTSIGGSASFGWCWSPASSRRAFISTSNRYADGSDGVVSVELESDPDCVVAISVNNSSDYMRTVMADDMRSKL